MTSSEVFLVATLNAVSHFVFGSASLFFVCGDLRARFRGKPVRTVF